MPIHAVTAAAAAAPAAPVAPAGGAGFAARLEAARGSTLHPGPAHRSPPVAALAAVEAAQARLDAVLAAARSGRSFTAGELLALQADAYRLSQALDVAGKLVEQGVQAVKQASNTQV